MIRLLLLALVLIVAPGAAQAASCDTRFACDIEIPFSAEGRGFALGVSTLDFGDTQLAFPTSLEVTGELVQDPFKNVVELTELHIAPLGLPTQQLRFETQAFVPPTRHPPTAGQNLLFSADLQFGDIRVRNFGPQRIDDDGPTGLASIDLFVDIFAERYVDGELIDRPIFTRKQVFGYQLAAFDCNVSSFPCRATLIGGPRSWELGDFNLRSTEALLPEPSPAVMLGLSLMGLAWIRRR